MNVELTKNEVKTICCAFMGIANLQKIDILDFKSDDYKDLGLRLTEKYFKKEIKEGVSE